MVARPYEYYQERDEDESGALDYGAPVFTMLADG